MPGLSPGLAVLAAACASIVPVDAAGLDPWADEEPGAVIPVAGVEGTYADASTADAGGVAVETPLGHSLDVAFAEGNLYLAERRSGDGVLRVVRPDGTTETVPGAHDGEYSLGLPHLVAPGPSHTLYLANALEVVRVSPDGRETNVAGNAASPVLAGEGASATEVLMVISDIASDAHGALYVANREFGRVYRVEPDGTLTVVVDEGTRRSGQDPYRIAVDGDGVVYVADAQRHRVDAVAPDGSVETFAGTGESGDDGDGGPAIEARISSPRDVAVDGDGNVYISTPHGIRWVDSAGTLHTVAEVDGDGDGEVHRPVGQLAADTHGNLYSTDQSGTRLWVIVRPRAASDVTYDPSEPMIPWGIALIFGAPVAILVGGVALAVLGVAIRRRRRGTTAVSDSAR